MKRLSISKSKKLRFYFLTLFLISGVGFAQDASTAVATYASKYPDAQMIRLQDNTIIKISLKKDKLSITQEIEEENLYLTKSAQFASEGSLDYSSFYTLNAIEAASLIPDGKKYKTYEVEDFTTKDVITNSFYDDVKEVKFLYPKLDEGAKSKLNYTLEIKDPRFLNAFYMQSSSPLLSKKVTIEADEEIDLVFKKMNLDGFDIRFRESKKRGKNIYTWEVKNVKAYEFEGSSPSFKTFVPHIVPLINGYTTSSGEHKSILGTEKNLYDWYYDLTKDINASPIDAELLAITEQLVSGLETPLDKAKAIYYWVQENIKYIDFEYGLGGFIPRDANLVFQKKYGDCKDNSSIMLEMFEAAGLEGHLTWIGTRKIPYRYSEVPTPAVDNHMILSFIDGDTTYFLDATGRNLPIDLPSSFIQGKEALVGYGEDFKVVEVPEVPALINKRSENVKLTFEGATVKGNSTVALSGYRKIDFLNALESLDTKTKEDLYYKNYLELGSNAFLLNNRTNTMTSPYEGDYHITYDFEIKDYISQLDNELFIDLNLDKQLKNSAIKKERVHDYEFDYKILDELEVALDIPEGYTASYIPENIDINTDFLTTSITYEVVNSTIIYRHNVSINELQLKKSQFDAYNELVKKISKAYQEVIILKKE